MAILLARVVLIAALAAVPGAALAQKRSGPVQGPAANPVDAGERRQGRRRRSRPPTRAGRCTCCAPRTVRTTWPSPRRRLPSSPPTPRWRVYVRLAPRATEPPPVIAQRSAVEEWLLGQRNDPLPMHARRVVQVPSGELPVGGPLSMSGRDTSGQSSAALALLERERTREKAAAAAREQERRDELEGRTKNLQNLLPFEDFDMAARVVARPGRTPVIRRALTSGPGDYDVVLGWAVLDGKNRPTRTGVLKHAITLPPAQATGLALGSIIVADEIQARDQHLSCRSADRASLCDRQHRDRTRRRSRSSRTTRSCRWRSR